MNPSSAPMAPVLADYHKKTANLRSQILKNEEERIRLEQKLRSLSTVDSRLKQQQQIEHIQSYYAKLDNETQKARQRNVNLLNDLTQAEHNLNQLRIETEQLIRLKNEYFQYLDLNGSTGQKNIPTGPTTYNLVNADSSTLYKRYEDQLKVGLDRTNTSTLNNQTKDHRQDDHSMSDTTSSSFSRSKRSGSLRMELSRSGLYFLLDYVEAELANTIDRKKFYHHDPPTITQKRTVLDIGNGQQQYALKDLEPTTTSMVILDQLPSTIRRTTVNKCLLTEDILSANIRDLDKDSITKMLPEQDRSLWIRLIDHFTRLVKLHIMDSQTLANKFAPILLPTNVLSLHEKAKSLLKHIIEKLISTHAPSSDDDTSLDQKPPVQTMVKTGTNSSSSWLDKVRSNGVLDDDETSSSIAATPKKNIKSPSSTASTPRKYVREDDSDLEFYS